MWQTLVERLALLELLECGSLTRREAQADAWDMLAELPWVRRTGRRKEVRLVAERHGELVSLLDRVWPEWRDVRAELNSRGLKPTPEGWMGLQDATRRESLSSVPERLNRRTAAALMAPHSKAGLTERRAAALGETTATHDGAVRVRPPSGLVAHTSSGSIDLGAVAAVLGEISLPERALLDGLILEGPLRAALLVENLGAFCDLPRLDGWLVAHVPGWDTATVARLMDRLAHVPVVHFGDLDPNGVRIVRHLRAIRPDICWFVPGFWGEFVEAYGLPCQWPEDLDLAEAPQLVRLLSRRSLWLEQEPVAVDPRTHGALETLLGELSR
jgi:hypothetical protein